MYTHVHPSKGNFNKDAEIKKKSNSFDIDIHVKLRILSIIVSLILRNINIRR